MSDVTHDHRVPELGALAPRMLGRALLSGVAFFVVGAPAGRARLSSEASVLAAWLPWIGLFTSVAAAALLAAGSAEEDTLVIGGGLVIGGLALLVAGALTVGFAAVERSVPPPRRPDALGVEPSTHPLWPHDAPRGLTAVAPGVYVAQQPLTFYGVSMGARTTVLALDDGLMVVSPIEPTPALLDQVRALGAVRWLVAPNPLHHLHVAAWCEAFPDAALVAAPGLEDRRPDLRPRHTLHGARPELPWPAEQVDAAVFEGHPLIKEIALLHVASGTLVVADLVMNLGHRPETSRKERLLLELAGMAERPGPPLDYKLTITEPAAIRAAAQRVVAWPIARVVPAHGRPVQVDAREVVADAFAFVLG